MMAGRQADLVVLSGEDRTFLEAQVRRHKAPRSLSDRCRMVLLCAEGLQSKEVAERLGVHEHTVGKWRRRFVQDGIEGLTDEYRAGRPRTVSDAQVAQVIERTLNTTPKDATHWSIRSMAAETGLSHTTIRRIWSAFGLQPHRSETFKLSTDPLFVDKVQDIVGLYMSPPNRAVVLCVDEKSQIQALDREQPVLPMAPGVPERRTHTYIRNGTTSLFAALDIATGAVIGKCYKRHRATEFLDFLKRIDAEMPEGPDVHLVMDNYATHKTPKVKACPPPALACALHANFGVLDQPGRTLVRRVDAQAAAARRPPIHGGTRGRYHRLHTRSQRKSQTLQMGQISRRNTRRR